MPTLTMPRLPLVGYARATRATPTEDAPVMETLNDVSASSTKALDPAREKQLQRQRLRRAAAIAATSLVVSAAAIIAARMLVRRYVKTNGLDL